MKKFICLIPMLFLSACGYVYDSEITTAQDFCKDHKGLAKVESTLSVFTTNGICRDGTRFYTPTKTIKPNE